AWIWAGVTIMAVILVAVMFWVTTLQSAPIGGTVAVQVPDIIGQTYESGAQKLTDLELIPTRVSEQSDDVPEGAIIRINPVAGTKVSKGFTVTVVVSSGPTLLSIPPLVNMTETDAIQALKDAGFEYG